MELFITIRSLFNFVIFGDFVVVGLGNLCYDFRNSMEPEPGRCRRTDGKKWRCSRDVVPDQKYCERHMHRGRNRSRKPVEGAAATSSSSLSLGPHATTPSTNLDGSTNNTNTNNNSSSTSDVNIGNSSGDVPAAAVRMGSTSISVVSSGTACKTGVA